MESNYDGVLIIGTALDNKQLEKQLREEEKQLQKYQDEHKVLAESKVKVEADLKPIEEQMQQWNEMIEDSEKNLKSLKEQQDEVFAQRQRVDFNTPEDIALVEKQKELALAYQEATDENAQLKNELNEINTQYDEQKTKLDDINKKTKQNEIAQDGVRKSIKNTNDELNKRNAFDGIQDSIEDINKGLTGIVKKAIKWGLAIFGIRTMFNFIRQSMSTIAQDDPQLKADIDYIKNALAYTIEPIVRRIVEWAKQILTFVGALIYKWTGYNIFKDANKHLEKARANASALQKTMAKFDEMTTLNKQGEGTTNPSFDFASSVEQYDFNKTYENVKKVLGKIKTSFNTTFDEIQDTTMRKMTDAGASRKVVEYWYVMSEGIQTIINGIGEAFEGVFDVIYGLLTGNTPLVLQGFGKIKDGVVDIVIGLVTTLVGLIGGLIQIIYEFLSPIVNWIWANVLKPIVDLWVGVIDTIISIIMMPFNFLLNIGREVRDGFIQIFEGILRFARGDFKGGLESIFSGIKTILLAPINALIGAINQLIKGINKIKIDVPKDIPGIGGMKFGFNLPTIPKIQLAKGGILNNPGKGVPVGANAYAGESGREFYMPLQDEQMLQLVGQSIGKYVTINANIINEMNGRVISRELQKIQNADDFAFNR